MSQEQKKYTQEYYNKKNQAIVNRIPHLGKDTNEKYLSILNNLSQYKMRYNYDLKEAAERLKYYTEKKIREFLIMQCFTNDLEVKAFFQEKIEKYKKQLSE